MYPKVLSLHCTNQCNLRCRFCYIPKNKRSKPLNWFLDIPSVARDIGIEQIAIGGGEVTLFPKFLTKLAKRCVENDIIPNLTTNGIKFDPSKIDTSLFGVISFSLDSYKMSHLSYHHLRRIISSIQKYPDRDHKPKIGINYLLLNKRSLYQLPLVIRSLDDIVDSWYILHLKYHPVDYKRKDLEGVLYLLSPFLRDKLLVDDSIQVILGKKEICNRGRDLVSIDPSGNVKPCSFDSSIGYLNDPRDLKDIVNMYYPMMFDDNRCPYIVYK